MSVKITQPSNMEHDAWRRLYIRLLTKELVPWDGFTQEKIDLEGGVIEDLIVAGYMGGRVIRGGDGKIGQVMSNGPTIAGRIFAEEQQDILDRKSLWGHIKSGAGLFIGWVGGILSAVIIWRLTK
jgi:hypothetical protein